MGTQKRAAATRNKLIEAAIDLWAEKGYQETTPKEVTKAAGLTPGAFYYHFKSKEELSAAIAERSRPAMTEVWKAYLGTPQPGLENIVRAAFAVADMIAGDRMHWVVFHLDNAIGYLGPQERMVHRQQVADLTALMAGALADSEIRADITRREAGELMWIAFNGAQLMSDLLEEDGPAAVERLALTCNCALRGIVPDEQFSRMERFVQEIAARYTGHRDTAPDDPQRPDPAVATRAPLSAVPTDSQMTPTHWQGAVLAPR